MSSLKNWIIRVIDWAYGHEEVSDDKTYKSCSEQFAPNEVFVHRYMREDVLRDALENKQFGFDPKQIRIQV